MDTQEIVVTVGGVLLIGFILWFFFGPKEATRATEGGSGVQEARVTVKGGYSPDVIEVRSGRPVRLTFRREESTGCTEGLPQGEDVALEFTPTAPGEYAFHCAMNMVRGKVVVRG